MPMAGLGSRFKDFFTEPKPFLKIKDLNSNTEKPMYEKAIETFTQYNFIEEVIIITLEEYKEYFKNNSDSKKISRNFIYLNNYTEGQAQTCFYANDYIQITKPIIISACDNSAIYDYEIFKNMFFYDIVIWTFNNDKELLKNENIENLDKTTYSWAEIDSNNNDKIVKVFTKQMPDIDIDKTKTYKPIVGTFYFKNYEIFLKGYNHIYNNNIRTKNEFYIENMFNYLLECGHVVGNFTIDKYIGWGIPEDYDKNKIFV